MYTAEFKFETVIEVPPGEKSVAQAMGLPGVPDWGDSTEWQYWVINFVKAYEEQQGYIKHPIGMTMQFPVADQTKVNEPLFNSPADWISPGYDDEIFAQGVHPMMPGSPLTRWADNPPASDGKKVIISDTDHYAPPTKDSALWAWKSFLRGLNPILMDFAIVDVVNPPGPSAGMPPMKPPSLPAMRWATPFAMPNGCTS
jgi:hypothetical protein